MVNTVGAISRRLEIQQGTYEVWKSLGESRQFRIHKRHKDEVEGSSKLGRLPVTLCVWADSRGIYAFNRHHLRPSAIRIDWDDIEQLRLSPDPQSPSTAVVHLKKDRFVLEVPWRTKFGKFVPERLEGTES